jgi:hypothetical protein
VSEARLDISRHFLAFAAVVEVGIGLAMLIDPAVVVRLLLGVEVSASGTLVGRFFGIALLALESACWPYPKRAENASSAFRAMLIYNVLFALYLGYLGKVGNLGGLLLWPAVAFHAVVALLLILTWRGGGRTQAIHT